MGLTISNQLHQPQRRNITDDAMPPHRALIALGSNLGDRVGNIESALAIMNEGPIKLKRTSNLWETKPMYVLDQEKFVNAVCEIETQLHHLELLDKLQWIESQQMGRVKVIDKGPRNIDLDILLYDDLVFLNDRLQIPHKLMLEREFVLRPLCDLIPNETLPRDPSLPADTYQEHLSALPQLEEPISPFTPLSPSKIAVDIPERSLPTLTTHHHARSTIIMSILNVTPDSFSDGGKNYNIDQEALWKTIKSHIDAGATMIDIGGQSTRPGSVQVSEEEECSRVLPVVELVRSMPEANNIVISIDTYRSGVAEKSLQCGADLINDVSAGILDPRILSVVASNRATICLMHMRGTPETMNELTSYPDGVVEGVGRELLGRVEAAEAAGIPRWRIILDPGIGFAKTPEQNLELLRRMEDLENFPGLHGLPWLVGTSRKAFVGKITGVTDAKDRTWGTAAAVTAAIQGGAGIIRVHDVQEMAQVAKMADAIWRPRR